MIDLSRWPDADTILDDALALAPEARDAFLRMRAGHDPALLAALQAVVHEAAAADGFLAPGAAVPAVAEALADDAPESAPHRDLLAPGACVEHYEIVELIGRGGMGEVYRARDRRLGRDIALKVLPERFAADADRLARFRREARVLASLSHAGIGAIYGLAEAEGIEALVLEYVAGPTLAERIAGTPLPVVDVLTLGRRIAEALDAAHARGVLHRDLKPANIKVPPDGSVKILDFGLAKALGPADHGADATTDLTAQTPHLLLGTASYMSPEQVRREPLDQRADIWAFGCLVFEMLTGTRAFPGVSVQDVLARVLEREPAYGLLPSDTPRALRRLLRRTLEKDPRRRLGYIGDALLEFDDAAQAPPADEGREPAPARRRRTTGALTAVAAGLIAAGGFAWQMARPAPATPVARFVVPLDAVTPVTSYQPMLALSPDGQTLAYRARHEGVTRVYLRRLSALEATPVPGTEGATGLFFSPDGQWLGFDADGVLKRVALSGGAPVLIGAAPGGVTATWAADDTIVFATNTRRVLERLPVGGGQAVPLTALDAGRGDTLHLLPQALPGGRTVLFTIATGRGRHIATVDLASSRITVVTDGTHGRFLAPDTLVFVRQGALLGQRFDPAAGTVSGTAVPLLDGLEHTDNTVVHFDASPSGSLAYLPAGQVPVPMRDLVWVDRAGRATTVPVEPRPYTRLALSPDGTRVAAAVDDPGNTDVWVVDLARGTSSRLTTEPSIETAPVWSPDGRWIAFRSERESPGLFRRDALAAGPIEQITNTDGPIHSPSSWSPDSRTLFFAVFRSYSNQAVASVTPPDPTVRVLIDGDHAQFEPQLSPDGRWLAYQSDESGRAEVLVRPYPDVTAGRWQVSTAGGATPRWSPDGGELFFLDGTSLFSMPVRDSKGFTVSAPRRLFDLSAFGARLGGDYEVSPDGRQFLFTVARPVADIRPAQLVVVQHWASEVARRMAEGR